MPSITLERINTSMETLRDFISSYSGENITKLVISLVIAYYSARTIYRIWFHPLSKFPGPKLFAAFNGPLLYLDHVKGSWAHTDSGRLHRKYGPVVRSAPNKLALDGSVAWPEVYANRQGKEEYRRVPEWVFDFDYLSIIGCGRELHRRIRRQLAHAFSDVAIKQQEAILVKYVDVLMVKLDQQTQGGKTVNIVDWFNFMSFDIIGELAYSESFHSLEGSDYHPWVLSIFSGIRGSSFLRFLKQYWPLAPIIKALRINTDINLSVDNLKQTADMTMSRLQTGPKEKRPGFTDFVDYMLRPNSNGAPGMSPNEVVLNTPILILAGSETTGTGLAGLLYHLSVNPRTYQTLTEEIRSTFPCEEDVDLVGVGKLQYLRACIDEVLRMYPPAASLVPRLSPGDMITEKWVPKGTIISTCQYSTFHNPDHFHLPDTFLPERWLPESHALYDQRFRKDNKSVYKPFGYGPRDCIGKSLAASELRLVIARLLYRFDVELAPGQEKWVATQRNFLVWEKGPLYVSLNKRM